MLKHWIIMVLCFASLVTAQLWSGEAHKVSNGTITVDGYLTEPVWASQEKTRIDNTKLGSGAVDGDGDCYVEFTTLYDNDGWYLAVWFHDDIHQAINSQYLDGANIAYDDDGLQILFDYSFDDAFNDQTGPYWQGLYGRSLVKGFGNLDPEAQYAGFWGEENGNFSTDMWTPDQQRAKGWDNIFTTADGVNYEYESKFSWAGELMYSCGPLPEGSKMGFCLVVNDNDGGFAAEGQMVLLPLSEAMRWGALTLSSMAGIAPAKASISATAKNGIFDRLRVDPLGRKITAKSGAKNMLIIRNQQGKTLKSITVR